MSALSASVGSLDPKFHEIPWDLLVERGWKGEKTVNAIHRITKVPLIIYAVSLVPEAMPALLAAGADINLKGANGVRGVLDWAIIRNPSLVPLLLASGVSVSQKDNLCLFEASFHNPHLIPLLVEAGAEVEARNSSGQTVLMSSISQGTSELLKAGANPNARSTRESKDTVLLSLLMNLDTSSDSDPIAWPYFLNKIDLLLAAGARVNDRNSSGESPLMSAACLNIELMEKFIEAGADLDYQDYEGYTALCWAAREGRVDTFTRLLAMDADTAAWEECLENGRLLKEVSVLDVKKFEHVVAVWKAWLIDGALPPSSDSQTPARLRL